MTTTGNGPQNLPVSPGMNISGTKATMLVRILNVTGPAISRVPGGPYPIEQGRYLSLRGSVDDVVGEVIDNNISSGPLDKAGDTVNKATDDLGKKKDRRDRR